jgi:hypothetical protein
MPARRMRFVVAPLAGVALTITACGGNSSARPCDQPVREELDPSSIVHVIDPQNANFRTNPPTSGPHTSSPGPTGALDEPIPGAVQVNILERGDVLVQYRDLDAATTATVRSLAVDRVVVAPNPTLPAPVVATAWTYKLTCRALDTTAIAAFVKAHEGKSTSD